jgi:plastocyanin
MKKFWPFLVVIIAIVAIVGIALANKDDNKAATPAPAPPPSSNSSNNASSSSDTTGNSANASQPTSANAVSISNMSYSPATLTVKKGTTVTWTNSDSAAHTVTADSGNLFDSGTLNPGKTFNFQFDTAGTFAYHCTFHSSMHGKVIVTE